MRRILLICAVAAMGLTAPEPAAARVQEETESGFVVQLGVDVPASPEDVWEVMVHPEQWWDDANTFSGDAANLALKPIAGGCFCEVLPATDAPEGTPPGGAEHMRVIYVEPPRALRMTGALGPLQPDPATGIMTMVLQKTETGTRVMWEYAVSGHLRKPGMAAAMDAVLTSQIVGLGEKLGARLAPRKQPDGNGEAAEAPEDDADDTGKAGAREEGDKPSAKDKAKAKPDEVEAPDDAQGQSEDGEEEARAVKGAEDDSDEAGDKADGDEEDGVEEEQSGQGEEKAEPAKSAKGKKDKSEPVSNDVEAGSDEAQQPKDVMEEADSSEDRGDEAEAESDEAEPSKPAKDAGKNPIIGR